MPTNSEMYERGALDAEHDDLNPFYYQHYYYYRKGYDEARRRLRRPDPAERPTSRRVPMLAALLAVVLVAAGGLWAYNTYYGGPQGEAAAASPTTAAVATARPTTRPTPRPTTPPTATSAPQLGVGARARVITEEGAPLRMRNAPGQAASLVARIPSGAEVELLEGPVEADGFIWWRVRAAEGEGWCAAGSVDGSITLLEPIP